MQPSFHVAAEFKIGDRRPSIVLDAAILGRRETLLAAKKRGYAFRPLRTTLARAIRFFLEHGMVRKSRVEHFRFDLRAFV
jgi:hypothetical protein